ncbi:hypothetical protein EF918_19705 [Streptomyces sp. WAC06614]|nr:hypothetical protein EF918_19705 [Streptomyces sp. WAC06614]
MSLAQVAGSSLATVAAALLASRLGVYGTILGAGVVSVVATAGGPVIQHVFRRTGDRIRAGARHRDRQVQAPDAPRTSAAPDAPFDDHYGEPTTHGTRVRGWKRTAAAAGAAFGIAIGGIAAAEAVTGKPVGDRPLYTTVTGGSSDRHGGTGEKFRDGEGRDRDGGRTPDRHGGTPDPDRSGSPGPDPGPSASTPAPSPSHSGGPAPTPSPTPPTPTPTPSGGTPDPQRSTPDGAGQSPSTRLR